MCATDLISRGVDTSWVEHVIQFDFPRFVSDYIHRAGRVGRIGSKKPGKVSSFVTYPHEISLAQKIEVELCPGEKVRSSPRFIQVTARLNRKLSGVNSDIKNQMELHAQHREQLAEKIRDRQAREELCKEVIRSAMV